MKSEHIEGSFAANMHEASNAIPFPSAKDADINKALHEKKAYSVIKRMCDILFASAALILLSPLLLAIAIVITLEDRESPIYVSTRCGKDGKPFRFLKFRTMHKNAEKELYTLLDKNEADGPVFKIKADPRITRVGMFLRKTSLDELPQIINVIKGDMSIVGPRPPLPREVAQYTSYQMRRLSVRPGLTCFWQVQPQRNSLSFREWVELDIRYINERSLLLDFVLVLRTIGVMCRHEGQ